MKIPLASNQPKSGQPTKAQSGQPSEPKDDQTEGGGESGQSGKSGQPKEDQTRDRGRGKSGGQSARGSRTNSASTLAPPPATEAKPKKSASDEDKYEAYDIMAVSLSPAEATLKDKYADASDALVTNTLVTGMKGMRIDSHFNYLELPLLVAEYKRNGQNAVVGTNQLRMYLTAAVKFLAALGIYDFFVFGVQSDGPVVALPAAVMRKKDMVRLYPYPKYCIYSVLIDCPYL